MATLGPVSSTTPGAGKMTFKAACAHAEKLGFSTLVRVEGCVGNTILGALDVRDRACGGGRRGGCFAEWADVR